MTPETSPLVPETFGPLQGVKILSSGTIIAQPFAALLAAEMGAEVIQIERPGQGDLVWRNLEFPIEGPNGVKTASAWVQERRNMFHVSLDLSRPEGKEIFLKLVARSDIWMESSKPGAYQKWGLDDETVLKANPKLVICHVSGYGQEGHPDYLGRASYDFVGQGFGGMMHLTGFPEPEPPVRAVPWTADYITAGFCLWSSLAGYIHAQRTGQGQVIDLAQYEAIHKTLAGTMVAYYEMGLNEAEAAPATRPASSSHTTCSMPRTAGSSSPPWALPTTACAACWASTRKKRSGRRPTRASTPPRAWSSTPSSAPGPKSAPSSR